MSAAQNALRAALEQAEDQPQNEWTERARAAMVYLANNPAASKSVTALTGSLSEAIADVVSKREATSVAELVFALLVNTNTAVQLIGKTNERQAHELVTAMLSMMT